MIKLTHKVREFSKVAGPKINLQKSKAFLYKNNQVEDIMAEKTPRVATEKMEYYGVNVIRNA